MTPVARLLLAACTALWAVQAQAQTADEVIEKHLAALGGRAALSKLQTRIATGTIAISTQGAELAGPLEIDLKAPNKSRTLMTLDLSQFGGSQMVIDQRCDGKTAYASNSMQGDRQITGDQLQTMLNAVFPTALLNYKEAGARVELVGKDTVGNRAVYVLLFTPKAGPPSRQSIDAETFFLVRTIIKVDMAELGGVMEQTTDISDYRDVGGIRVPFAIAVNNPVQTVRITLSAVEHNKPLDDALFSRPAAK